MKSIRSEVEGKFQLSRDKVFEVAVVSTMSSGKSTFINALIGLELLPSQNQACTTRTTAVLDNDNSETPTAHLLFSNGKYEHLGNCNAQQIADVLQAEKGSVADIILECSVPGIRNIKRALLLVDTPGVNNSADTSHEAVTRDHLRSMSAGLIVYVMNAQQIGTTDDLRMLEFIKSVIQENPVLQLLFILNKADALDPEKEPIEVAVSNCVQYLRANGIASPSIFPISSEAALIFKKAASGIELTKAEGARFARYYDQFRPTDFCLSAFAATPGREGLDREVFVRKQPHILRNILSALENTGIPAAERAIEERLIDLLGSKAPKVRKPTGRKSKP